MKTTRLSRKRFLQLKKELVRHAKEVGYDLVLRPRKLNWNNDLMFTVGGYCQQWNRKLVVYYYGRPGHAKILHTMAHELRHAIHEKEGLYKDYYSLNFLMMRLAMKGQKVQWKWPNLGVAIRAERDCDRWADKWLKDRGITYIRNDVYSFYSTMAYSTMRDMQAYENRIYREQPIMHQPDERSICSLQKCLKNVKRLDTSSRPDEGGRGVHERGELQDGEKQASVSGPDCNRDSTPR